MSTCKLNVEGIGQVELTINDQGTGAPILLLHGGAGPQSVAAFANLLTSTKPVRVVTPTHPGFGGTARPETLKDVRGLALTYAALLKELDLTGVTVVGNSIGGWIASELALLQTGRIGKLVLVSGTGIDVPGHPVADPFKLSLDELMKLSYHQPEKFKIDIAALPPPVRAVFAANRAALGVYAGQASDPSLLGRLPAINVPTVFLWGESDRIIDADYVRAFTAAIPGAAMRTLPATGHVPQIETPELLANEIGGFMQGR